MAVAALSAAAVWGVLRIQKPRPTTTPWSRRQSTIICASFRAHISGNRERRIHQVKPWFTGRLDFAPAYRSQATTSSPCRAAAWATCSTAKLRSSSSNAAAHHHLVGLSEYSIDVANVPSNSPRRRGRCRKSGWRHRCDRAGVARFQCPRMEACRSGIHARV